MHKHNFSRSKSGWLRHQKTLSGLILVIAMAACPASISLAQGSALPELGDGAGISLAAERRLGESIASQLYRDPDFLDDPLLVDYLNSLWTPLLEAARARGDVSPELSQRMAWRLLISRDKRVNAFALPGGYLGVHLGLVAATETAPELASVLAHELSHVSQRHIARMLSRQQQQAPWIMGALILGVLAARANPEVANAAITSSQALAVQGQLNFSREMEREADRVGFGVLTAGGFDGQGFVGMFDKLQQAARLNDDGAFPYLRSHPLTSERVADIQSRLALTRSGESAQLTAAQSAPSTALHALMAARASVLAENGSDRQRAWAQAAQSPQSPAPALYAAALSAHRLGQSAQALALAQRGRASASAGTQTVWELLGLEILMSPSADGSLGKSQRQTLLVQQRDRALGIDGRAALLLATQAALLTQGELPLVAGRLTQWLALQPQDAQAWLTLSRVQAALGQKLRSVRSEAESRAAQLDYAGAIERLRAAQSLPEAERRADSIELAIVDVRLRDVQEQLRESARQD